MLAFSRFWSMLYVSRAQPLGAFTGSSIFVVSLYGDG